MARKTGKKISLRGAADLRKRVKSRLPKPRSRVPAVVESTIFWPDRIDHVRAIAMRGYTDDEMASVMGVSSDLLASWKAYYPMLAKAIEEGRTKADAEVVAALHRNAVGYSRTVDEVVRSRRGAQVLQIDKFYPGETSAQKYWLSNRNPSHWGEKLQVGGDRSPGATPIQVKQETKNDVINTILNMIQPQPDKS